jgi:hypothetical protein
MIGGWNGLQGTGEDGSSGRGDGMDCRGLVTGWMERASHKMGSENWSSG